MLKVTVLGCWAPYPRPGGACSGYLVQQGETSVLVDIGHGVMSKLGWFVDFRHLTAVVITHFHPDHFADIFALRHAIAGSLRDGSRGCFLEVFFPSEPQLEAFRVASFSDSFRPRFLDELPEGWVGVGDINISFYRVPHKIPSYAVGLETEGIRIVYSGDTSWCRELVEFASGSELFICEASLLEEDRAILPEDHLTAREAGILGRQAGVKRLLLTHFWPEYNLRALAEQAGEGYGRGVELAQEGERYEV